MKQAILLLSICLLFSSPVEESNMFQLGDRLIQAIDGTLSPGDLEKLRMDLNRVGPAVSAVSGWLPNGGTNPEFAQMSAANQVLANPPMGGSYFGYDQLAETPTGTTIALTSTYYPLSGFQRDAYDSQSIIIPYDLASGKFMVNPIFSKQETNIFVLSGNIVNTPQMQLFCMLEWRYKSDDTSFDVVWINAAPTHKDSWVTISSAIQTGSFPVSLDELYFEVQVISLNDTGVVYPTLWFMRLR
jgi:hypothetical protein